jgi:hypothetical protein
MARKQKCMTFPLGTKYHAVEKLQLVHSDLCSSVTPVTPGGKQLCLLLVDDASCYMWLMLLTTKDGALSAFATFQARADAEAGRNIRTLCTDCGGEFMMQTFSGHCTSHGV